MPPEAALRRFFTGLLDWAGVERPFELSGGEAEVRMLESGRDRLLFVLNHAAAAADLSVAPRGASNYTAGGRETGPPPRPEVWVVLLAAR